MCKTNPISGGRDAPPFQHSIIPASQPDADRAKRTQLAAGVRNNKYFMGKELCQIGPAKGRGETKPIPGDAG